MAGPMLVGPSAMEQESARFVDPKKLVRTIQFNINSASKWDKNSNNQ